jgi:pyruvate ferredoxin oxidoreductase delta subunit
LDNRLEKAPEGAQGYEGLRWVAVHGRGVIHTGHANAFVRVMATAGNFSGKESYYYMRYDDSPERDHIPHMFYAVFGDPSIDVVLHEEVEPVGEVFDAIVVMDSSMLLHQTSQRALLFDGAKRDAVLVVNTSLSPSDVMRLVKRYALAEDWEGKLVTVRAKDYGPDITFPLLGALAKTLDVVAMGDLLSALDFLGLGKNAAAMKRAYEEASPVAVKVRSEETELAKQRGTARAAPPSAAQTGWWDRQAYESYKTAASEARSYSERMEAMPRWEALAPGLIEFGPRPGERNIGFKTSFSRSARPVIDAKKCTDCKLCSLYCPDGAIDFEGIEVDYDYCQGCAICAQICPPKAIAMVDELEAKEGLKEEMVTTVAEALREYGY